MGAFSSLTLRWAPPIKTPLFTAIFYEPCHFALFSLSKLCITKDFHHFTPKLITIRCIQGVIDGSRAEFQEQER